MKISFNSHKNGYWDLDPNHGFGNAGIHIIDTLKSLGYAVEFNDPTADIGFVFNHPNRAHFYPHQYNILYFPWESTEVQSGWLGPMKSVDELWTPSPWCQQVFQDLTGREVFVYEHGIDHIWKPKKRVRGSQVKFMHQGAEAARKNYSDTRTQFLQAFTDTTDVSLTLKHFNPRNLQNLSLGKVISFNEDWSLNKLVKEYTEHDVYVYPSSGEGFGLTPLQAMATGMPTITVGDWAPYYDYLDPRLTLHGTLSTTTWSNGIHPGKMYRIDPNELREKIRFAYDNFDDVAQTAYELAPKVHERYDWTEVTRKAFDSLEHRLNS